MNDRLHHHRPLDQIARDQDDDVVYLEDKRRERAERQSDHAPNEGDAALSQLLRVLEEDEADLQVDMSTERLAQINALHLPARDKGLAESRPVTRSHKGETETPVPGAGRVDFDGRDAA